MQYTFQRWEKKYLLTDTQVHTLTNLLTQHMQPGDYGNYWVQNVYFDTPNWDVIDLSMQKPYYKEKMRLRYYAASDQLFLELKKKYAGIVYKRRVLLPSDIKEEQISDFLAQENSQTARELLHYRNKTSVQKRMYLSYRRTTWAGVNDPHLRLTFDRDIRYRTENFSFSKPEEGKLVLPKGLQLMEIKTPYSVPLWFANACSQTDIFSRSYSKYATCFLDYKKETGAEKMVPYYA